jgi:predicted CXXCH cytochrome family protein
MRIRTAKALAQRIDLNYFKRAHGLRRWRYILSIAIPVIAVLWIAGYAAAGSRKPYSAGPVSRAHAFAEPKCEVCHASASATAGFRAHVSDKACLTCHDAPVHAANQTAPPDCASCHVEHSGRVQLAKVGDGLCLDCHGDLKTTHGLPSVATSVGRFPSAHPEFAVSREQAKDPGTIKFNHAVHLKKEGIRSLKGVEVLQCTDCHRIAALAVPPGRETQAGGVEVASKANYAQNCARCHGLEFDYRTEQPAPHDKPEVVHEAVRTALQTYIASHPDEIGKPDDPRRLPLNFPRPPEPPARSAADWVTRRSANAERLLWSRCEVCHVRTGTLTLPSAKPASGSERVTVTVSGPSGSAESVSVPLSVPTYAASNITARWMRRAMFDHRSHLMVQCTDCHAADRSQLTADVLMPKQATCATCHAPAKGAEARCFECHRYHDWSKSHPVSPAFKLTDFK